MVSGVTVFLMPVLGGGLCDAGVVVVVGVAVLVVACVTGGVVPGRTPPAFMAAGLALVVAFAGVVAVDAVLAGAGDAPPADAVEGATLPAADCVTVPPAEPQGLAAGWVGCDFFLLKRDAMP